MIRKIMVVAAAGTMFVAGQAAAKDAPAAQLSAVKGGVNVSQNGKFVAAKAGALKVGDRVVAGKGEAKVSYADGCIVTVAPQSMATIAAASPCATGQGLVTAGGSSAQFSDLTTTQMVVGAVAVGGLIAGIVSLADSDDEDAVTP
jgi:hypothetical protein